MTDLVQAVFEEISLERNPKLWQSELDTRQETIKRIQFLAQFEETQFVEALDTSKSPGRKNNLLSEALLGKAGKATETEESLRLCGQALVFSGDQGLTDNILRKRIHLVAESGVTTKEMEERILTDLTLIETRSQEEERRMKELQGRQQENGEELDTFRRHPRLRNFRDCVMVKMEEGRGRYLVAAEDILPGHIIANEKSFSAMLDRKYVSSHCDLCLVQTTHPVPCPGCSTARFCSLKCRGEALSGHHKYECLLQDCIYRSGTGAWPLALRIVSSRPLQTWQALGLGEPDESFGLGGSDSDSVTQYCSQDVRTAYNLVTHQVGAHRSAPSLMKESLTAVFLLRILQQHQYCGPPTIQSQSKQCLSPAELSTCLLLHHFMRVVFYNSHEVPAQIERVQGWASTPVVKIGVALNPSLALINHSCDPNYARVTRGTSVLSFATRKIKKGEEIQDVYSGTALRSPKEEREEVHARYNFTCCCQACIQNWPMEQGLARNVTRRQVKENVTDKVIKQLDRDLKEVTSPRWLSQVDAETALHRLVSILTQTSDVVRSPNYLVAKTEELLHSALWSLHR